MSVLIPDKEKVMEILQDYCKGLAQVQGFARGWQLSEDPVFRFGGKILELTYIDLKNLSEFTRTLAGSIYELRERDERLLTLVEKLAGIVEKLPKRGGDENLRQEVEKLREITDKQIMPIYQRLLPMVKEFEKNKKKFEEMDEEWKKTTIG